MYYKINNGSISYGADTILEQINIEIKDHEKIAIVGRNGCGKTTLLKAIVGEVELEEGTGETPLIISKSNNISIGYLKQIAFEDNEITLNDEFLKHYKYIISLENKLMDLVTTMESNPCEKVINEYSATLEKFENLGGYTYHKEYLSIAKNFGFEGEALNKKLKEFSGGQRTKIAFIKLLLSKPDILLLDEPTNHLDLTAIEWLERYLKNYNSALVIVSHDRMFLNNIVDKVYEIEYGETRVYKGNYEAFEKQKKETYEKQLKDSTAQKKEIARLTKLIERFRYKATKAKMVQSKIKLLERMQIINPPNRYDLTTFHTNFQPDTMSYKDVLSIKNLVIGYTHPLAMINFAMQAGDKLGIIGDNGIGKSTLLKTLVGTIAKLEGRFDFGAKANIGYFDQQMAEINSNKTILQDYIDNFPTLSQKDARSNLGAFQFSGEDVFKEISCLSGGEKVRLTLCKILGTKPNILILDEPTNHLDIVGKERLESMLQSYEGTVLFVSHDRYFVNKIANKLLVFENGNVEFFNGTYTEYCIKKQETQAIINTQQTKPNNRIHQPTPIKTKHTTPLKELDKRKKKLSKIELEIDNLNKEISNLRNDLDNPQIYSDYIKVTEIELQITSIQKAIEKLEDQWTVIQIELEDLENK